MHKVLIIFAHPQFEKSLVNRALIQAAHNISGVKIHDLYEQYPHFHINVGHEQRIMQEVNTIILQHPFQWYSCPALMKEWLDVVLSRGWAYGPGGEALKGKRLMNVISTGGTKESYQSGGHNFYNIDELLLPFVQTARLCGMDYLSPVLFHNAISATPETITVHANKYRAFLSQLVDGTY